VLKILRVLRKLFPYAKISLHYSKPVRTLGCRGAFRAKHRQKSERSDADIVKEYRMLDDYIRADRRAFERDIRQSGFYRAKAKNISATAKVVKEMYVVKWFRTSLTFCEGVRFFV
jgi:endonuclease III